MCLKTYLTCLFLGFPAGTFLGPGLRLDEDVEVELVCGGSVGGCVASRSSDPCRMQINYKCDIGIITHVLDGYPRKRG